MQKSKKFIGIIAIIIFLTACSGETEKTTGIVNADVLKVRSEADVNSEILFLLERGAIIKIISEENGYYQIIFEGQDDNENLTGYVKKEYVNPN